MAMGHRLVAWVPALFATVLSGGCGSDEPPTDLYELSGFVHEAMTNAPVEGARVRFVSDTLYRESTTTDDDGLYEMVVETDTPFGQVIAEKDGYVRSQQTVFFDTERRRVDLVIRRAAEGD